jgi:hypothetical protein
VGVFNLFYINYFTENYINFHIEGEIPTIVNIENTTGYKEFACIMLETTCGGVIYENYVKKSDQMWAKIFQILSIYYTSFAPTLMTRLAQYVHWAKIKYIPSFKLSFTCNGGQVYKATPLPNTFFGGQKTPCYFYILFKNKKPWNMLIKGSKITKNVRIR